MAAEGLHVHVVGGISSSAGNWWLCHIMFRTARDKRRHTCIIAGTKDAAPWLQALIDGKPIAGSGPIAHISGTDQLAFKCRNGHIVAVARALIAPQLASALKLRQPSDLGAKPLDGS